MARIPEEEIERLKREVSLERLCLARGIELARHGADLVGLCPFHDDNHPSLVVTPAKNLWHCLGACAAGGSVIDWVMKSENVSFRHAVELLREGYPAAAVKTGSGVRVRMLPSPVVADATDGEILKQVVAFYHETLPASPEALAYLEKRGIKNADAIERFQLGYANRSLGYRLPPKVVKAGAHIRGRLAALGVLRESGHEHGAGSISIPILGLAGEVQGMYFRKIRDDLRPGTPSHLYLPGPHKGVWNEEALSTWKEIILCEALIDALTFWCAGFKNVTCSWGVNGFTDDHLTAMRRHGTERVLIAYDRDEAGEKAAETLAPRLIAEGLEVFRVQFPRGMDANQYALKVTPADKSLGLAIKKAVWIGRGSAGDRAPAEGEKTGAAKEEKPGPHAASPGLPPAPLPSVSSLAAVVTPPAASPMPEPAVLESSLEVEMKGDDILVATEGRRYRVRGLAKNTASEQLKVNLLASKGESYHVDNLDLYSARLRSVFISQAARELAESEETIRRDLGRVLMKLEELHEEAVKKAVEPKRKMPAMSEADAAAAEALLANPRLFDRILADFERCGVVGEETNKLVGYLAALSRKLEDPLAIVIQSSSAAGKSSLMEAVLAFVPEEERVKYSAMTGQSLFYIGEQDLAHKVLAIVEEKGAEKASYSLKLLQSEGELSIASTGKDPATGRLVTHEYHVKGPVMIFLTTTAPEIDEELLNRCIVLSVDEEREQTRAIHRLQRERQTLEGLLARQERVDLVKLHQNAQRLLRPLLVANPFARELTFLDDRTRTRRDHVKYLTLIRAIALLQQRQRPVLRAERAGRQVEYIEATLEDVALANRLAHQVLGRSLDELPPQTRRLLVFLDRMTAEECRRRKMSRADWRFTRREVRQKIGWQDTQLRLHLARLVELEYLIVHHGTRGQSYVYELVYDGQGKDGAPFLSGLLDVEKLKEKLYDKKNAPLSAEIAGPFSENAPPSRGQSAPEAGGAEHAPKNGEAAKERTSGDSLAHDAENAYEEGAVKSHTSAGRTAASFPLAARLSPSGGAR